MTSTSYGTFNTEKSIEQLAIKVDIALKALSCEMQNIRKKYELEKAEYSAFMKKPFLKRIFSSQPAINGDDIMFRLPAIKHNHALIMGINNLIIGGADEIYVSTEVMDRIIDWSK